MRGDRCERVVCPAEREKTYVGHCEGRQRAKAVGEGRREDVEVRREEEERASRGLIWALMTRVWCHAYVRHRNATELHPSDLQGRDPRAPGSSHHHHHHRLMADYSSLQARPRHSPQQPRSLIVIYRLSTRPPPPSPPPSPSPSFPISPSSSSLPPSSSASTSQRTSLCLSSRTRVVHSQFLQTSQRQDSRTRARCGVHRKSSGRIRRRSPLLLCRSVRVVIPFASCRCALVIATIVRRPLRPSCSLASQICIRRTAATKPSGTSASTSRTQSRTV